MALIADERAIGYALVPLEPTQEMLNAACAADLSSPTEEWVSARDGHRIHYQAMLAAAPAGDLDAALKALEDEVRRERARAKCWQEDYDAVVKALAGWPALPDQASLEALGTSLAVRAGDWERGKEMQREQDIAPRSEAERGAGLWWRVTGGAEIARLRAALHQCADWFEMVAASHAAKSDWPSKAEWDRNFERRDYARRAALGSAS